MKLQDKYVLIRYNKTRGTKEILVQSNDVGELILFKMKMMQDLPTHEIEENVYWVDDVTEPLDETQLLH
jgi:hypothetical protein